MGLIPFLSPISIVQQNDVGHSAALGAHASLSLVKTNARCLHFRSRMHARARANRGGDEEVDQEKAGVWWPGEEGGNQDKPARRQSDVGNRGQQGIGHNRWW